MKVLLDHNLPIQLKALLIGYEVFTAREMLWDRLANGMLVRAAEEAGFAVMLTADKNMFYQQNHQTRRIALLVLSTNDWPSIREHAEAIVGALSQAQIGGFVEVDVPLRAKRAGR